MFYFYSGNSADSFRGRRAFAERATLFMAYNETRMDIHIIKRERTTLIPNALFVRAHYSRAVRILCCPRALYSSRPVNIIMSPISVIDVCDVM